MRLPYPVFLDKVPVVIYLTDGKNEQGAPNIVKTITTKCTFNEKVQNKIGPDGKITVVQGKVLLYGDIAPDVKWLQGHLIINSKTYIIHKGIRTRNPDGTVHHSELELK